MIIISLICTLMFLVGGVGGCRSVVIGVWAMKRVVGSVGGRIRSRHWIVSTFPHPGPCDINPTPLATSRTSLSCFSLLVRVHIDVLNSLKVKLQSLKQTTLSENGYLTFTKDV